MPEFLAQAFFCEFWEITKNTFLHKTPLVAASDPGNFDKKTYLFYDTVHIMNNIRTNLLNGYKFVFPKFDGLNIDINFPEGFIHIYNKDKGLSVNLCGTPKHSCQAVHPGNNKQSVPLALAIIHGTTYNCSCQKLFSYSTRSVWVFWI